MGLYSTTIRIHSDKPAPLPTATRKNQTLLMLMAKWLDQALGGLAKVQGFEVQVNSNPLTRAAQTVTCSGGTGPGGAYVSIGAGGFEGFSVLGITLTDVQVASYLSGILGVNSSSYVNLAEASSLRATIASIPVGGFVAGTKLQVGQWQFVAVSHAAAQYGEFLCGVDGDTDAVALAAAINQHPQCGEYFHAVWGGSSNVYVFLFGTAPGGYRLSCTASAIALTQAAYVGSLLVRTVERTAVGNLLSFAASGWAAADAAQLTGAAVMNVSQLTGVA